LPNCSPREQCDYQNTFEEENWAHKFLVSQNLRRNPCLALPSIAAKFTAFGQQCTRLHAEGKEPEMGADLDWNRLGGRVTPEE
jgi:hypothetical protein